MFMTILLNKSHNKIDINCENVGIRFRQFHIYEKWWDKLQTNLTLHSIKFNSVMKLKYFWIQWNKLELQNLQIK